MQADDLCPSDLATDSRRQFLALAAGLGGAWMWGEGGPGQNAVQAGEGPVRGISSGAEDSDVGNLYSFISGQAVQGEFPLSFLNPEFRDPVAWRSTARERLLELLHYAPAPCDPQPEVVGRRPGRGYTEESVWFNTTGSLRVPARVLVPEGLQGRAPAIVALHDHGGMYFWGHEKIVEVPEEHAVLTDFKSRYYGGRSIASELARQGYVVIVIDMFYWGARRMLLAGDAADWRERPADISAARIAEFNQRASQSEQLVGRTIYAAGFTWPGVIFWDDLRTVDYLCTRPDVDPQRIGCVGLSVGGLRSCHLAALDDRIRAAVVVGWMASFPAQLKTQVRNTIGFTKLVPGLYRWLDYPDVATLAMPRPLLVINGRKDALFDLPGVERSFEKLHACYAKAGAADRVTTRLYDTPHEFNVSMQTEAWEFLQRWL